ncbi:MAG: hypothetical protein FWG30_03250 [Eubacteriaceae bacterium]|nr:hypothetical protein [Eubacteriaceae bacterium]
MKTKKALLLACLAILAMLSACTNNNNEKVGTGEGSSDIPMSIGTWDGKSFENKWSNIAFSLPDNWSIASREEVESIMGIGSEIMVNDGIYTQTQIDLSSVRTAYDFYIYNDLNANIILLYENLAFPGLSSITQEQYFDEVKSQLEKLETLEYEFVENGYMEIAGEEYYYGTFTVQGGFMAQTYYIRKYDKAIISFITTYTEANFDSVEELFNRMEPAN